MANWIRKTPGPTGRYRYLSSVGPQDPSVWLHLGPLTTQGITGSANPYLWVYQAGPPETVGLRADGDAPSQDQIDLRVIEIQGTTSALVAGHVQVSVAAGFRWFEVSPALASRLTALVIRERDGPSVLPHKVLRYDGGTKAVAGQFVISTLSDLEAIWKGISGRMEYLLGGEAELVGLAQNAADITALNAITDSRT